MAASFGGQPGPAGPSLTRERSVPYLEYEEMISPVDLVIFHYHLLPGGITTVIRQGVEALARHSHLVSRVRIVAGRIPEGMEAFPGAEVVRLPDIDYASVRFRGGLIWRERAQRLADSLREQFAGDEAVWWIHNYHLGKNPLFTEALLRIADAPDGPRMILQPHDFPEAGRYGSLSALDRLLSLPLYPDGPRIRYALINERDLLMLRDAGIPECRLFLLENPVPPLVEEPWTGDRKGLRALLFPDADPRQPTLLYPVRAIRRKNVLEAGMLLRLVDIPLRLVVTLPGVSRPEREYSSIVENAFRDGLIPGEFAAGVRRPDLRPDRMAAACDLILSTSIQEGFGYLFVQALQWGLPLLARRLETIPGAEVLYGGYPARFYTGLSCPISPLEKSGLLDRYRDKLKRLRRLLSPGITKRLDSEISRALAGDSADFSFFDAPLQARLLAAAEQTDFRSRLRNLNGDLAGSLDVLLSERPPARAQAVEARFGPAAYAARVDALLASFGRPSHETSVVSPAKVGEKVRARFAHADQLKLLFD